MSQGFLNGAQVVIFRMSMFLARILGKMYIVAKVVETTM